MDELHDDGVVEDIGDGGDIIGVPAGNHASPISGQLEKA